GHDDTALILDLVEQVIELASLDVTNRLTSDFPGVNQSFEVFQNPRCRAQLAVVLECCLAVVVARHPTFAHKECLTDRLERVGRLRGGSFLFCEWVAA